MSSRDGKWKEIAFVSIVFGLVAMGFYRERERSRQPIVAPADMPSAGADGGASKFERLVLPFSNETATGNIRTSDGDPASGVEVLLSRANIASGSAAPLHWLLTAADGRFAFDELEPGEYRVVLSRPGARPETRTLVIPLASPVTWQLEPLLPELKALPTLVRVDLAGRVEAPANDGLNPPRSLEHFEVVLRPAPGVEPLSGAMKRRARLAADGSYFFEGLVTADYVMQLLPPWAASSSWPVLDEAEFTHSQDATGPALSAPGASIVGRLMNTDGLPIPGALVRLWPEDDPGHAWPPSETDDQGNFSIRNLPLGQYHVLIHCGSATRESSVNIRVETIYREEFAPLTPEEIGAQDE